MRAMKRPQVPLAALAVTLVSVPAAFSASAQEPGPPLPPRMPGCEPAPPQPPNIRQPLRLTLSVGETRLGPGETARLNFALTNRGNEPFRYSYQPPYRFDFSVRTAANREIARFSDSRPPTLRPSQIAIVCPGKTSRQTISWGVRVRGRRLAPGRYLLVGTLPPSRRGPSLGPGSFVPPRAVRSAPVAITVE